MDPAIFEGTVQAVIRIVGGHPCETKLVKLDCVICVTESDPITFTIFDFCRRETGVGYQAACCHSDQPTCTSGAVVLHQGLPSRVPWYVRV